MQVTSNGRVRRSEAEWQEIVARWKKSGQKPTAFCRREEIQLASFLRWQRKLDGSEDERDFVPVMPSAAPASSTWSLTISLPNGCELRFQG